MATPKEVQKAVVDLEVVYSVPVNGGVFNALKKLTPTEIACIAKYVGAVFTQGRAVGRLDVERSKPQESR